jgi:hypothetical protein
MRPAVVHIGCDFVARLAAFGGSDSRLALARAGILWRLLPLMLRFDRSAELRRFGVQQNITSSISPTCEQAPVTVSLPQPVNVTAVKAAAALSRLGGYGEGVGLSVSERWVSPYPELSEDFYWLKLSVISVLYFLP